MDSSNGSIPVLGNTQISEMFVLSRQCQFDRYVVTGMS